MFVALWSCLLLPGTSFAAQPGFVSGKFAVLALDGENGDVLFARDADAPRHPASLTKVMTLYLVFDDVKTGRLKLSDKVPISPHAAAQAPSKLGLRPGDSLTVRQAIDVVAVKSANDIAVALAERVGGSEIAFVQRMNGKARALGMRSTHFQNASGLPDGRQITTARDLATLSRALLRDHPRQYAVFDRTQAHFRGTVIPGHNRLLALPGVDGIKTGYTRASGFNLITSVRKDRHRLIAVVMGGVTAAARDSFMRSLIGQTLALMDDPIGTQLAKSEARTASTPQGNLIPIASGAAVLPSPRLWRVQVGGFATQDEAQRRLGELQDRHPRRLGDLPAEVAQAPRSYTVRFTTTSREVALERCNLLSLEGEPCISLAVAD